MIEQARVVDISRYWRTGGIDWQRLKENFDAVIMSAGVGFNRDMLLEEHIGKSVEYDVPYATFHIPDPSKDMGEQAQFYAELPGVKTCKVFGDWEKPYQSGRLPDQVEFHYYLTALDSYAEQEAAVYSRMEIIKRMGSPDYLKERDLWLAQYIYEDYGARLQYSLFETFLEKFGMRLPPSVDGTGLEQNVKLWQFTEYGDARFYCANRLTSDPKYVYGMTKADLNVSVDEVSTFLAWFGGKQQLDPELEPEPPLPPVEPCCICKAWEIVSKLADNAIKNCNCRKD